MDVSSPIRSVIPGVTGSILQVLARTTEPLTGVAIAELTDGRASRAGVNKALAPLVESGVVGCRPVGPAKLYWLNRDHVAAEAIVALSDLRGETIRRVAHLTRSWKVQPIAVWLFGSAARGDGDSSSDFDILLVGPPERLESNSAWQHQTMVLAERVTAWTGNHCEILEHTESELRSLANSKDRLVRDLLRDAITVSGPSASELMRGAR